MTAIDAYSSVQQIQRLDFGAATAGGLGRNNPVPAPPREPQTFSEPADLRSRLDDLIVGEVVSGRLTIGQAEDLRGVFNEAFGDEAADALQPQSPPPAGRDAMDSPFSIDRMNAARSDAASSAPAGAKAETTASAMQKFIDALQASVESSASVTYGATGQNNVAAIKTVPPLLLDYRT